MKYIKKNCFLFIISILIASEQHVWAIRDPDPVFERGLDQEKFYLCQTFPMLGADVGCLIGEKRAREKGNASLVTLEKQCEKDFGEHQIENPSLIAKACLERAGLNREIYQKNGTPSSYWIPFAEALGSCEHNCKLTTCLILKQQRAFTGSCHGPNLPRKE